MLNPLSAQTSTPGRTLNEMSSAEQADLGGDTLPGYGKEETVVGSLDGPEQHASPQRAMMYEIAALGTEVVDADDAMANETAELGPVVPTGQLTPRSGGLLTGNALQSALMGLPGVKNTSWLDVPRKTSILAAGGGEASAVTMWIRGSCPAEKDRLNTEVRARSILHNTLYHACRAADILPILWMGRVLPHRSEGKRRITGCSWGFHWDFTLDFSASGGHLDFIFRFPKSWGYPIAGWFSSWIRNALGPF